MMENLHSITFLLPPPQKKTTISNIGLPQYKEPVGKLHD